MSVPSRPAMSDTKWREVWTIVAELRLRVQVAFLADPVWNAANSAKLHGPFPGHWVGDAGIGDPGIGGPFRYSALAWLRVPRAAGNDLEAFRRRVEALGVLPVTASVDRVEVLGYLAPPRAAE